MISLVKCGLFKYCILLMKMALDALIVPFAKYNLFLLTNVGTLLGLNTMMPMLEAIHSMWQHMWATSLNQIGASIFFIGEVYGNVVAYVKQQCQKATI